MNLLSYIGNSFKMWEFSDEAFEENNDEENFKPAIQFLILANIMTIILNILNFYVLGYLQELEYLIILYIISILLSFIVGIASFFLIAFFTNKILCSFGGIGNFKQTFIATISTVIPLIVVIYSFTLIILVFSIFTNNSQSPFKDVTGPLATSLYVLVILGITIWMVRVYFKALRMIHSTTIMQTLLAFILSIIAFIISYIIFIFIFHLLLVIIFSMDIGDALLMSYTYIVTQIISLIH